ncbi:MAG TPA: lactate permease LctP family transporter [Verrucomicrobiae bacterium]|nr:lactate permease LctP family transporter [Verrucomicrobiae bacterium]
MWSQGYTPLGGSVWWSALVAGGPLIALLVLLGVMRKPAWVSALVGLGIAALVSVVAYGMPAGLAASAAGLGAVFGLFPIGWVVFNAILLYRITVETGQFEIVKDSVGGITDDRRLQALLIAFAFGAFIEGAAGFGTPVAVAAAMLTGLGFSPFYAAGICLLANTAPVAFGSIGTPILTLGAVTGLPVDQLSAKVGQLSAPVSLFVPAYLLAVMGGWRALKGVWPAALACGGAFAAAQFLVSRHIGPQLTDILSSLAAIGALLVLMRFWRPADGFDLEGHHAGESGEVKRHPGRVLLRAWAPYGVLVLLVLAWGFGKGWLGQASVAVPWPGLHGCVVRTPPVVASPAVYPAVYSFEWLAASGTACLAAALISAALLGMRPSALGGVIRKTARQLALPMVTVAAVLALAFLMNYSGATATLGLAFAATGRAFPFFSAMLGWVGVFLTGSDTSANALFGNLQAVTAGTLGLDPVLMAAANSSGGVMGKMISLQSIAVAAAATGMATSEEGKLFRFTLGHSVLLAAVIGLVTALNASL